MTTSTRRQKEMILAALTLLALVGCGKESDRPSDVHTLRVLAVRSETPFAKPGASAALSMLAFDGSPRAIRADGTSRANSTLWIGGCINPPGDDYVACMPYLQKILTQVSDDDLAATRIPADVPNGLIAWGERFLVQVPADIVTSRQLARGVAYPYGIEIVFFARCGGVLRRQSTGPGDFPLGCFDAETGEQFGRDDFEFGFYPLFAYDAIENHNPSLAGVTFEGSEPGVSCSDSAPCSEGSHCGTEGSCIPVVARCTKADKDDCKSYRLSIDVPRESVERAVVAHVAEADASLESLWISYYADAGSFEQDARIINDAHTGWSNDVDGKWRANLAAPREVRLWAVLRDNRNGVAWAWRDLWVE